MSEPEKTMQPNIRDLIANMKEMQTEIVYETRNKEDADRLRKKALEFVMEELELIRRNLWEIGIGTEAKHIANKDHAKGRQSLARDLLGDGQTPLEKHIEQTKTFEKDRLKPRLKRS